MNVIALAGLVVVGFFRICINKRIVGRADKQKKATNELLSISRKAFGF